MNKYAAFACTLTLVALVAGCETGGGGEDNSGIPDIIINVDYGQLDDNNVGPDNTVTPDVVVVDDEGNPVDTSQPKDTTQPKDTNEPKDDNVAQDEGGTDTNTDTCVEPASCAFETVNGIRDNCDGTFTDTTSGLMWQAVGGDHQLSSPTDNLLKRQCNTAKSGCDNGVWLTGWRVPTIDEVRTLVRGCPAVEEGGSCPVLETCYSSETCLTSACDGCGTGNGDFSYVDDGETYYRYVDPRMLSEGNGVTYSAVMSGTNTNKTTLDSNLRFFYILNYNGKLDVLKPTQPSSEGTMFCVREAD